MELDEAQNFTAHGWAQKEYSHTHTTAPTCLAASDPWLRFLGH
jgi:hypothetical protein